MQTKVLSNRVGMQQTKTQQSAKPAAVQMAAKVDYGAAQPLIDADGYLAPFAAAINARHADYTALVSQIEKYEGGSLAQFSLGYKSFGLHAQKDGSVSYKEWAPNATAASLIGEFNNWDSCANKMSKDKFGVWTCVVPAPGIPHNSKIKLHLTLPSGEQVDRIPAWITRVTQDLSVSPVYDAVFWNPPRAEQYKFVNTRPPQPKSVKIYEAHVGISTPEMRVGTYDEFTRDTLPRIHALGYNCIQLMATQEHAYYASFGYQVTSFFAPSSRYGTPEQLMRLIDTAHGLGITVLLDIVHSHACKNVLDGINMFDGSDNQYFHSGPKGDHELWGSRLFNYGSHEVLRFLLSNLRYYIDVYQFDGFRFDGVTSMLYNHHGIGTGFSGGYPEYFGSQVDNDAVVYLMMANNMIHSILPNAITIAEDVSGMPSLCRPVSEAGVGFDYRLQMAVPDMWIKLLKETDDSDWDYSNIVHTLTNRRYGEKTIAYAESHDQALVGDKTLAFWLMDKEMYTNMSDLTERTPIIDRGLAFHKMIRLIVHALGGEGYLNFEGNEFGHPEWLDFPREGNGNSFQYARRQFNLVDDGNLRYRYLNNFDCAMNKLEEQYNWLSSPQAYVSLKNQSDRVIVFERGQLLFVFNFHPTNSYTDYRIGCFWPAKYKVIMSSDEKQYGGHGRLDLSVEHFSTDMPWNDRPNFLQLYLPTYSAMVLSHD